jgi:hypothetical protein
VSFGRQGLTGFGSLSGLAAEGFLNRSVKSDFISIANVVFKELCISKLIIKKF